MQLKIACIFALLCLALVLTAEAGPVSQKKGRVLPGALAVKKLVLLKFKKIIPISLILLRSGDENEAELVPVYPSGEIPANVQFIPTPNGISGDKEVQAIAIPTELHEQLAAHGMADLEHVQAMLSQAEEDTEGSAAADAEELLNIKEDDENQLLTDKKPTPSKPVAMSNKPAVRTAVEELPLFLYSAKEEPKRTFRRNHAGRRRHA